ncbi:transmembrane E3 ubiquitin-protein ligase FLY2-like isoform X2 [Primulina huaijiensis]|uniref:transmembrane E3 ubiquitin-protein ligase FLY2-like isoform X2 n=1 Tax=Primulina huaijiensis TaxID=1492673 RepID=UPI003CC6DE52
MGPMICWKFSRTLFLILFWCWFSLLVIRPVNSLRPLRQRPRSWGDEWLHVGKEERELDPFTSWNITGTYRGNWKFQDSTNNSSKFPDFGKANGNVVLELISTPTKLNGVHYVQGVIIFHDVFDNEHDAGGAQLRVEGVYIWPFRQLRMVASSGKQGEFGQEDDYILSNPYHLLGVFSSQVFQESPREKIWKRKHSPIYKMEKHCNIEIAAQVSGVSSSQDGDHHRYHLGGLMESPSVDDNADCFSPMLLNATSVNIEVYYNKAINYTLMVTFISFLEVLLLIRQMEHSNTQSGAAKVSLPMIAHQAIMDAYLCLMHLTAGILVDGILLGGILVMYEFHRFLRFILLLLHSFWIPQIITNVSRDSRKPLHPHYILGITITRIAIPLYVFGCPHNFMRIEPDREWCIFLTIYMGLQAFFLLLQHYFGSRWFIPRQILPEKYCYYRRFDQGSIPSIDCVICMTAIDFSQRTNDCMVTPCDHFFHSGCLQRWMDIKMECPTCRRPLPPA